MHRWTWRNANMAVKHFYFVLFAKQTDCSHAMRISSHWYQQGSLSLCCFTPQYTHKNTPCRNPHTIHNTLLFLARLYGPPNADTGIGSEQKMDRQPCLKPAEWTFHPSKAYWLRDAPAVLTFKNFTFCPHAVFMSCVYLTTKCGLYPHTT